MFSPDHPALSCLGLYLFCAHVIACKPLACTLMCADWSHVSTAALSLHAECQAEDIRSAVEMLQKRGKAVKGLLGAAALTR